MRLLLANTCCGFRQARSHSTTRASFGAGWNVGIREGGGEHLLASGWLQGAIFKSNDVVGVRGNEAGTLLVVLTQSCTVVSSSLDRDPLVEVAVVTPEGKEYKPKSQEGRGQGVQETEYSPRSRREARESGHH